MEQEKTEQLLEIAQKVGVMRPRDLDAYGVPRWYLHRMFERGLLEQVERGLYAAPNVEVTEHRSLVETAKRVPNGVICLLSALSFYELTTQNPRQVWMAISEKARRPQFRQQTVRVVYFSGAAFSDGVEEHLLEGVPVRIYNPAKTVADCFKYRNKIGLDVAMEALRDVLIAKDERGQRLCSVDELWHYANVCRVTNVIKPYLEAMLLTN